MTKHKNSTITVEQAVAALRGQGIEVTLRFPVTAHAAPAHRELPPKPSAPVEATAAPDTAQETPTTTTKGATVSAKVVTKLDFSGIQL